MTLSAQPPARLAVADRASALAEHRRVAAANRSVEQRLLEGCPPRAARIAGAGQEALPFRARPI